MQIQELLDKENGVAEARIYVEPSWSNEVAMDYHQVDVLAQLKANVAKLTELHFKLNFMICEISHLTSKK